MDLFVMHDGGIVKAHEACVEAGCVVEWVRDALGDGWWLQHGDQSARVHDEAEATGFLLAQHAVIETLDNAGVSAAFGEHGAIETITVSE